MKISKYALYAALLLITASSCKKQLDLSPTDSLTPLNAFRSIADAQSGTNEAYNRYTQYYNTMYLNSLLSDEARLGKDNAGQGALTFRYQFSSDATSGGDVITSYYDYYFMIDQVNRVLAALPNVIALPTEEPRRTVLRGQLLALRAIAHFGILQAYCKNYDSADTRGIPYMTVSDPYAQPARLSMGADITLIKQDLDSAYLLSPAVTAATFTDTVINQVNINAYRARIALYKGDYANAINYATAVITSGVRPLATAANFPGIWKDSTTNVETLFRIRTGTRTVVGQIYTTTGGLIYIAPANKLINEYAAGDIRKFAFIGGTGAAAYVNKFYSSARGGRAVDVKACRISEMYLIRAEAYAKSAAPDVIAGAADLNTLRTIRIAGYVPVTFSSATDLATAVADERYKELCFEGFRFFDLKRNNQPVQRDITDVTSTAWQTLPAGDFHFVLPIPQDELLANPNMVQNDGY